MKPIRILFAAILVSLLFSTLAHAFVPATLSYQGSLYNADGSPFSGVKDIKFSLYTVATGGTAFWTETQSAVNITNGRFATVLGNTTAISPAGFTADVWLGIQVVGDSTEMTPRQQMTSVAFAFSAGGSVPIGGIIMWSGTIATIPSGWALCDGNNGTPNLTNKFVIAAATTGTFVKGATGGSVDHFHKGYPDGGDLRAMAGVSAGGYFVQNGMGSGAVNPNTMTGTGVPVVSSVFGFGSGNPGTGEVIGNSTPVLGFTSKGFQGIPTTGGTGSATAGSLPPYYALAYIMRTQ